MVALEEPSVNDQHEYEADVSICENMISETSDRPCGLIFKVCDLYQKPENSGS
jgi:hypothetical protein